MNKLILLLLLISSLLLSDENILYKLDFTQEKDGDAKEWLKKKGFKFKLGAKKLSLQFVDGELQLETTKKRAGLIALRFDKDKYLENIDRVTIVWGVHRFPDGADWENGTHRLSIGAFLVLGAKKYSSGLPFGINAAPHFLGPFIGQKEILDKQYTGSYYKKAGRYYCVSNKHNGEVVTTDFNIDDKFQESFDKQTPPLTGFAFQMNTKNTKGDAKAFIKSITFYGK